VAVAVGLALEVSAGVGSSEGEPAVVAVGAVVAVLPGRTVGRTVGLAVAFAMGAGLGVGFGVDLGAAVGLGDGVGVGLGVGVGVGLGVGVAGSETANDAACVTHHTPFVLNRNVYVQIPTGFVNEPLYTTPFRVLPPELGRVTCVRSWNWTRARDGKPPLLFVYVTVKVNVVVRVPLPGETPPAVRLTGPHVAETARVGVADRSADAPRHIANASAHAMPMHDRYRRCRPKGGLRVLD
jgi:hypothetical protein